MIGVRPGYLRTDAGVIPDDWSAEPLGSLIGSLEAGVSVRSMPEDTSGTVHDDRVLKTSCIAGGAFFPDEAKCILPEDRTRARTPVRADTVLISRMNTPDLVGEVGYVPADFDNHFLPDRLWMAHRAPTRDVSMRWLAALLAHGSAAQALRSTATGTSGSMKNISKPMLRGLVIACPRPREQRAIAEALGSADALIGGLEVLIAKKRDIKQGAMQELLTGQRRLPGFQGEWITHIIGSIFDFGRTVPLSRAQLRDDGDMKYVHYGDIHTRFHTHLDFTTTPTPAAHKSLCRVATTLQTGDWVFADASEDYDGVAKAIEITRLPANQDAVAGLHTFVLRERARAFAPGFKGYLAHSPAFRAQVVKAATGMKVYGISKTQMKEIELRFPPTVDEQGAIAAVLADLDAEIAAVDAKLAKARAVKQGMMQVLLTGEVRLV